MKTALDLIVSQFPENKVAKAELATLRALLREARECVAYDVACDHLNSDRDLLARIDAALADE
jgi:hypothetical protein